MIQIQLRSLSLLAAAGFNLAFAVWLWWRYGRSRLHRHFALTVAGLGSYSLFVAGLALFRDEAWAVQWVRACTALPYFGLLAFFKFAMIFGRGESPAARRVFRLCLGLAALDVLARFSGLAPVRLTAHGPQGWFPDSDPLYFFLYMPTMAVLMGGCLWLLWRRLRATTGLEASQLRYIFVAVALTLAFSLFNLLPGAEALAPLGPVAFSVVVAYAITRQRLLDVRIFLRRGAVLSLMGLLLGFVATVSLFLAQTAWGGGQAARWFSAFVSGLLFTLGFDSLRRLLNKAANRLLGLRPLDPNARLLEYSQLAGAHPRLEAFFQAVCEKLRADFGLENAGVLLVDPDGSLRPLAQTPFGSLPEGLRLLSGDSAARRIAEAPQGLDFDALSWTARYELEPQPESEPELRSFMLQTSAQALFPLLEQDRLLGCLVLGAHRDGQALGPQEAGFFAVLARLLSQTLINRRLQGQVEQADRLSALGTLAASLTHEIRNPLSSIGVFLQMLPERHQDKDFIARFMRIVGGELEKLQALSKNILDFARPGSGRLQSVDLAALAERQRQLLGYQFSRRRVRLELELQRGLWVQAPENELAQVLVNLLLNALDVSAEGARVRLTLAAEGDEAVLRVRDEGPGVPAGLEEKIFDPYFSTKPEGTGLGLALSRRMVEAAGGRLEVARPPEGGAEFIVRLPRREGAASPTV